VALFWVGLAGQNGRQTMTDKEFDIYDDNQSVNNKDTDDMIAPIPITELLLRIEEMVFTCLTFGGAEDSVTGVINQVFGQICEAQLTKAQSYYEGIIAKLERGNEAQQSLITDLISDIASKDAEIKKLRKSL
jgi:hypothetical protein